MITIIDYDMGNLKSVSKALEAVGAEVCITRNPHKIKKADKVVLPGVGAFGKCMENLKNYGLIEVINESITSGKWFLGICLGLQLLFEESEEFGPVKGLGILKGKVKKFNFSVTPPSPPLKLRGGGGELKIPHMGWNQVKKNGIPMIMQSIPDNASFYFVHSYYVEPIDKKIIATETDYAGFFCSSIQKENILATQFHPEKSQKAGLKMLENFVNLK